MQVKSYLSALAVFRAAQALQGSSEGHQILLIEFVVVDGWVTQQVQHLCRNRKRVEHLDLLLLELLLAFGCPPHLPGL